MTRTTIDASGRYMRLSAPTSVAIGTTLEVGASVTKNHVARNATAGQRSQASAVAAIIETTVKTCGHTSVSVTAGGSP